MSTSILPKHIAIIMDGNGRWAKKRLLPRVAGHKAGVDTVDRIVEACVEKNIGALTLYAFSNENWLRPAQEVSYLMQLFLTSLEHYAKKIHKKNVQLRIIGDRSRFDEKLRATMGRIEQLTAENTGLKLIIAVNYGGQWDISEAMRQLAREIEAGKLTSQDISPELIKTKLSLADVPDPDLFIRTSGEQRISNFLIWQLSYSELYFTDVFWPDFDIAEFEKALSFYANRERRFGMTSEQIRANNHA